VIINKNVLTYANNEDIVNVNGRFDIPDYIQRIGDRAFWGCSGLTHLSIPKGVVLGEGAFLRCTGLTHLIILEGVTIGEEAFWNCTALTEITLNKGLVSIAGNAFDGCNHLNNIWVYSHDEVEIERIKGLLPVALQGKCAAYSLYQKIEGMRKAALESLFLEPKISDAFVVHHHKNGFFAALPTPAILKISQFLGDESGYYRKVEQEMYSGLTPTQIKGLASYQVVLNKIVDKYKEIAEKRKHYPNKPEQGAASTEGKGSGGGASFGYF
jgi:hypothetical protein